MAAVSARSRPAVSSRAVRPLIGNDARRAHNTTAPRNPACGRGCGPKRGYFTLIRPSSAVGIEQCLPHESLRPLPGQLTR